MCPRLMSLAFTPRKKEKKIKKICLFFFIVAIVQKDWIFLFLENIFFAAVACCLRLIVNDNFILWIFCLRCKYVPIMHAA